MSPLKVYLLVAYFTWASLKSCLRKIRSCRPWLGSLTTTLWIRLTYKTLGLLFNLFFFFQLSLHWSLPLRKVFSNWSACNRSLDFDKVSSKQKIITSKLVCHLTTVSLQQSVPLSLLCYSSCSMWHLHIWDRRCPSTVRLPCTLFFMIPLFSFL